MGSPTRLETRSYLSQRLGLSAVQKSSLDKPKSPARQLRAHPPHGRVPEEEKSPRDLQKSKRARPSSNSELNRTAGSHRRKAKASLLSISRTSKPEQRDLSPQRKAPELQAEQAPQRHASKKREYKLLSAKEPAKDPPFKAPLRDPGRPGEGQASKQSFLSPENVLCPSPKANLSLHAKKTGTEADLKKRLAINSCKSFDAKEYLFTKQDLQSENDPRATGWSRMKRKSFNEVEAMASKQPQTSNKKSGSPPTCHSRLQSRGEEGSKKKPATNSSFLCNIEIKIQNKKDFTPLFF